VIKIISELSEGFYYHLIEQVTFSRQRSERARQVLSDHRRGSVSKEETRDQLTEKIKSESWHI